MIYFPKKSGREWQTGKSKDPPPYYYYYDRKTKEEHVPSCVFLHQLTAIMLTITPQHYVLVSLILPKTPGSSSSPLVTTTTARPRSSHATTTLSSTQTLRLTHQSRHQHPTTQW